MDQYSNLTTLLLFTLGFFIVLWTCKYHWSRRWLYYYGFKINGLFGFPLIGSIYVLYQKGIIKTICYMSKKHRPLFKFWFGPTLIIVPTDAKTIELLTRICLNKSELYSEYLKPIIGDGLITSGVSLWKQHKKIILPLFNQNKLNSHIPSFVKHANVLVEKLRQTSNQVEILPYFAQYSTDSTIDFCMGTDSSQLEVRREYNSWLTKYEHLIISNALNPLTHVTFLKNFISTYKELIVVSEKTWNFVGSITEKKRKENLKDEISFLSHLIKVTDKNGGWTNEELMDELQTIVIASTETSMITECFVMLMLAIHPKIQQRVYDEIFTIFGNSDRDITSTDLNQLIHLECAIKETLRIFPTVPLILRSVNQNIVIDSQVIPKGSTLLIPIMHIHQDPKYWLNPFKFDPERFLPENISRQERYSYLPFGVAPRNCIGYNFALMSIKTVLATVLRNFELTSCQYKRLEDIEINYNITISARHGFGVTLKAR